MDVTTYNDIWVNLATNSPFLGWMIYSYIQTNKLLEKTRDESKAEGKEIRLEAKAEEQKVRDRFEKVITDLNNDRTQLVEGFSSRISSLERGQKKKFTVKVQPLMKDFQINLFGLKTLEVSRILRTDLKKLDLTRMKLMGYWETTGIIFTKV